MNSRILSGSVGIREKVIVIGSSIIQMEPSMLIMTSQMQGFPTVFFSSDGKSEFTIFGGVVAGTFSDWGLV